ncbi:MAG TPA: GntR family transcriptional regulator [Petrotogaceae bacterium]|jgi:GntR family transcriptional regulator|nr:GntR family transcriptional regulator [Petrotogaceae bacterium]HQF33862.1 GntR family transcriptional regulator [Petrotogaceae bacterium]HQH32338.1 GntR family transcriptional regulator [Petrotogaceae bacterium]HQI78663.1 GntR family transcriptional regulator [Petrotogaceae bacterium]
MRKDTQDSGRKYPDGTGKDETNTQALNLNNIPIYYKIYQILKARIEKNEYKEKLPTENELCQEFNVSRLTMRNALQELKRERILSSHKGRGTYIIQKKREEEISSLAGLSEEASQEGRKVSSLVLHNALISPPSYVFEKFEMPTKGMVLLIERVRYLDDEPYGIEKCYLNPLVDIRILSLVERDFSRLSIYKTLKEEFDIKFEYAQEIIEIARLSQSELRMLDMKDMNYGLLRHRYTYVTHSKCIEYVESIYRGDKYKLKLVRRSI